MRTSGGGASGKMTNEELDKVCCEFAGLKKENHGQWYSDKERLAKQRWPPVSTDGNAMVKLMEALSNTRHIELWKGAWSWHCQLDNTLGPLSDTAPVAVALAVTELAKAAK